MEGLHKRLVQRNRKLSLSTIIERIVLERQRDRGSGVFDQVDCQNDDGAPFGTVKIEELHDNSHRRMVQNAHGQESISEKREDAQLSPQSASPPVAATTLPPAGASLSAAEASLSAAATTLPSFSISSSVPEASLSAPGSSLPGATAASPAAPPATVSTPWTAPTKLLANPVPLSANPYEEEELDEDEDMENKDESATGAERLKAFNMFVRLYADESLDRTVPISKQPKERIQAILDSCCRQFPEFGERARKRLRTYLKACRRHKRSRHPTGAQTAGAGRASRPSPGHLTSAQADDVVTQAYRSEQRTTQCGQLGLQAAGLLSASEVAPPSSPDGLPSRPETLGRPMTSDRLGHPGPSRTAASGPATGALYRANVAQLLRQLAPGSGSPQPPDVLTPGELFFRRQPQCQLTAGQVTAVRQLVTGFRHSASFLRRSADELEVLVQQAGH